MNDFKRNRKPRDTNITEYEIILSQIGRGQKYTEKKMQ